MLVMSGRRGAVLAVRVSTAFLVLYFLHCADIARPVANSTRSTKTSEQHRPPPAACLASSVSSSATTYSPDLLETSNSLGAAELCFCAC
jgi:hypothetical protein